MDNSGKAYNIHIPTTRRTILEKDNTHFLLHAVNIFISTLFSAIYHKLWRETCLHNFIQLSRNHRLIQLYSSIQGTQIHCCTIPFDIGLQSVVRS